MKKHWITVIQWTSKFLRMFTFMAWDDYPVILENLLFSSFSRLIEAMRRTKESMRRTLKPHSANCPNPMIRPLPRKRPVVAAFEKGQSEVFKLENLLINSNRSERRTQSSHHFLVIIWQVAGEFLFFKTRCSQHPQALFSQITIIIIKIKDKWSLLRETEKKRS